MAKKANVRFRWLRSVSTDVKEQIAVVAVDGETVLETTLAPETEELLIDIKASSSVVFRVDTVDNEGEVTPSQIYTFVIGNLEPPQPATGLTHEILGVVDVPVSE